jgi:hypothetical protein
MPSVSEPAGRREELDRLVGRARSELRDWADSTEHDPGVAIVELLAFVGDTLSTYQDLIADEADLGTARRRPAGIRLEVDGERWREVPSLADSGPDDDHYVVTTQDDGATVIQFGDGEYGRRPPAGSAIRVRYRPSGNSTSVLLQEGRVVIDADWNEASGTKFCGIYRTLVVDNVDPLMKRRLRVLIPEVAGDDGVWAMACMPAGDPDTVPSVGDPIWVAFESCDPLQPVWLGRLIT